MGLVVVAVAVVAYIAHVATCCISRHIDAVTCRHEDIVR